MVNEMTRTMDHGAKYYRLILVGLLLCLFIGCATSGSESLRTELYFGQIPQVEWDTFLAKEVTPRFPEGLTVVDGIGQWRDPSGKIEKEHARILILIHGLKPEDDGKIEELRKLFCERFHQQSVLRVDQHVQASF